MKQKLNRIVSMICMLALVVTSFGFVQNTASAETVTLNPSEDAHVRSGIYKGNSYPTSTTLEVKDEESADGNRRAYIKFDFGSVSETIQKATLRFCAVTVGSDLNRDVNIYSTDEAWAETSIKWENMPAGIELLGTKTITNPTHGCSHSGVYRIAEHPEVEAQWYELDVTDYVNDQTSDKIVAFLVMIAGKSYGSNINIASSEHDADKRPQLVIETVAAPDPYEPEVITPVIKTPIQDTVVALNNNTVPNPFSTQESMPIRTGDARRAYLKFNISDFEKNLQTATLRIYVTSMQAAASRTLEVRGLATTWTDTGITWSNAPSAKNSGVKAGEQVIVNPSNPLGVWTGGQWYEIDVSDYVRNNLSSDEIAFALFFRTDSANDEIIIASSEAAVGKPELVLTPRAERSECEDLPNSVTSGDAIQITSSDAIAILSGAGSYVDFLVHVADPGAYSVMVRNHNASDRAIYQLSIDGTDLGSPVDQYNGTGGYSEAELGKVIFETAGVKLFRFTVTGQNDSSSGYNIGLDYIRLSKAQLDKVEAVTADPPAGLLEGPADITLSTATADATIYYKIDDAASWTPYAAPIHISQHTTISAYAVKPFMNASDITTFRYTLPVDADVQIIHTDTGITLDGVVETDGSGIPTGEWAGAELIDIAGTVDEAGIKGADIYLMFDYEMLYLGAKVKDPTPMVNDKTGTGIWNGDCLEIFMGVEDLDCTVYPEKSLAMIPSDLQLVISSGTSKGYQYYLYSEGNGSSFPGILIETRKDSDNKGYTIEAKIPLAALGLGKPWENGGKQMIINPVLSDGGTGGRGQFGFATNTEVDKKKRSLWGAATFEAAPAPETEIDLSVVCDDETQIVTITGKTLYVQNDEVAMIIKDPSGNIAALDQATTDENGAFSISCSLNVVNSLENGTYTVMVGGRGIKVPAETTFSFIHPIETKFTAGEVSLTDQAGNALTELSPSGSVLANVDVTNHQEISDNASMIVALFNANHTLKQISIVEKAIAAGQTTLFEACLDLPSDVSSNNYIKVFVWDSVDKMNALSDLTRFPNE